MDKVSMFADELDRLMADPTIEAREFLTDNDCPEAVEEAGYFAASVLIGCDGRPNMAAMKVLADRGYRVGPGEQDSFGWLTGLIHTPKGVIMYG